MPTELYDAPASTESVAARGAAPPSPHLDHSGRRRADRRGMGCPEVPLFAPHVTPTTHRSTAISRPSRRKSGLRRSRPGGRQPAGQGRRYPRRPGHAGSHRELAQARADLASGRPRSAAGAARVRRRRSCRPAVPRHPAPPPNSKRRSPHSKGAADLQRYRQLAQRTSSRPSSSMRRRRPSIRPAPTSKRSSGRPPPQQQRRRGRGRRAGGRCPARRRADRVDNAQLQPVTRHHRAGHRHRGPAARWNRASWCR